MITVGIPTYQRSELLEQAIVSVLNQSFEHFELLIVDNASQDGTEEICSRYARHDSRVTYVRNNENLGMSQNLMRIVELSKGKHLKFLMDDDVLLPGCLEAFHNAARSHPQCSLFACLDIRFTREIPEQSRHSQPIYAPEKAIEGNQMLNFLNQWGNQIGCPTNWMFRTDSLKDIYGIWGSKPMLWVPDIYAVALVLEKSGFYAINETLVGFRVHAEQLTKQIEDIRKLEEDKEVLTKIAQLSGGTSENYAYAEMQLARLSFKKAIEYLSVGQLHAAKRIIKPWKDSPKKAWAVWMAILYLWARLERNFRSYCLDHIGKQELKSRYFRNPRMKDFWKSVGAIE